MAKSITITRSIKAQGGTSDVSLISTGQRASMEFTFNADGATAVTYYATVSVGSYSFRATKISVIGSIYTFVIDLTDILSAYLGQAPFQVVEDELISSISLTIKIYDDTTDTLQIQLSESGLVLCYGYNDIGIAGGMELVYNSGANRTVYHNGKISFFLKSTTSPLPITINGIVINYPYIISAGYQIISLATAHKINGGLSCPPTVSFPVVYVDRLGAEIAWINRDGAWSFWNFRLISREKSVKKSNEVAVYATQNQYQYAKSIQLSTDKSVMYSFDTIAFNTDHYNQLTEIIESPRVIFDGRVYGVKSCSNSVAANRQNLNFKLTLEIEENVISR